MNYIGCAIFHNHFKELQLWQYQATVVHATQKSCSLPDIRYVKF